MTRRSIRVLFWVSVFGVAMGYFEAAVVVYLRRIMSTGGMLFPLAEGDTHIILVELGREFFSIVMLAAVGALAGRRFFERFCLFCLGFGVWDIFYYVFLKVTINWPDSLATWDILFQIPGPWVGPVWAPVVCSLAFIAAGILAVRAEDLERPIRPSFFEWLLSIAGGLLCILSWCLDSPNIMAGGMPARYPWPIFAAGLLMAAAAFALAWRRALSGKSIPAGGAV